MEHPCYHWAFQIAQYLAGLHRAGITYTDLSSKNIMISSSSYLATIDVSDSGSSKREQMSSERQLVAESPECSFEERQQNDIRAFRKILCAMSGVTGDKWEEHALRTITTRANLIRTTLKSIPIALSRPAKPQTLRTLTLTTFTKSMDALPQFNDIGLNFRKQWVSQRIHNEVTALKLIGETTTIPVPKVLDVGHDINGTFDC